jgi:hypothetical protein
VTHPDLDRLTSWVHGFAEPAESEETRSHVTACAECRWAAEGLREEARILSQELEVSPEISSPERLRALQEGLLRAATAKIRPARGLLWQVPVAAAVLLGLVGVLLSSGPRHSLVDGEVRLKDGRVLSAPSELAGSQAWHLEAQGKTCVRLSDRSTVNLGPGAELTLVPEGPRGVGAALVSGQAEFSVAPDSRRLSVRSPAGGLEAADGKFSMRIVFEEEGGVPVKNALAGAIVTVLAGSVSLLSPGGQQEAQAGQSAVLSRAQPPLLLLAPQDQQEPLLRRLEQLAARVAKLEEEVTLLDLQNKALKLQLAANPTNGAWGGFAPGQSVGGLRVSPQGPGGPGSAVIIELKEENPKKPEENPKQR